MASVTVTVVVVLAFLLVVVGSSNGAAEAGGTGQAGEENMISCITDCSVVIGACSVECTKKSLGEFPQCTMDCLQQDLACIAGCPATA